MVDSNLRSWGAPLSLLIPQFVCSSPPLQYTLTPIDGASSRSSSNPSSLCFATCFPNGASISTVSDLTVDVALLCRSVNKLCARVEWLMFAMPASQQSAERIFLDHSEQADYAEQCRAVCAKYDQGIPQPMRWPATRIMLATRLKAL